MGSKSKIKRVLIIDHNETMAKCLADMVDVFGIPCQIVFDGEAAIEHLKKQEYSLVIADTKIPKVSVFTLLKFIRQNFPDMKVAIISTRNSEKTQSIVVKNQPDFYLPKPFKTADIEKLLSQL